jgi:hypothetical protein
MKTLINKKELLSFISALIENRINKSEEIINYIEESIHSETKSTAGDKHDTSRELLHQERNKAAQNLNNQLMKRRTLIQLKNHKYSKKVGFGSLLHTNQGWVFIGLSIGNIEFREEEVLCISPISPFAKALEGADQGECIEFNDTSFVIETII